MSPELPRNIKLGQIRRTIGLVSPAKWRGIKEDERAAVDALSLHSWWRARQEEHEAFEGEEDDCVFLTVPWMQGLLRAVGARKTGEKSAAAAIALLKERGHIEDTGKTKKPRRSSERVARAETFQTPARWPWKAGRTRSRPPCARTGGASFVSPFSPGYGPPFLEVPTGSPGTARSTQRICPHSFAVKA